MQQGRKPKVRPCVICGAKVPKKVGRPRKTCSKPSCRIEYRKNCNRKYWRDYGPKNREDFHDYYLKNNGKNRKRRARQIAA